LDFFFCLGGVGVDLDFGVGQLAVDFFLPPLGRPAHIVIGGE
jgi:hypothetical protein